MAAVLLYQLGAYTFEVAPLNIHETTEETGHDLAAKDIIGAHRPREAMGEADNRRVFEGLLFPRALGGFASLEGLKAISKSGVPQLLLRGDGAMLGFWFVEKVKDKHEYLDRHGVGRMIGFSIDLVKSPLAPSAEAMMSTLATLVSLF